MQNRRGLKLISRELPEIRHIGEAGEDIAVLVHRHALDGVVFAPGHEAQHLAVADLAPADAVAEAGIIFRVRQRIRDVDHVVPGDEDAAGPAELLPFAQELALLVEDLDAVVGAVGDEDASLRVDREAVRRIELAGS